MRGSVRHETQFLRSGISQHGFNGLPQFFLQVICFCPKNALTAGFCDIWHFPKSRFFTWHAETLLCCTPPRLAPAQANPVPRGGTREVRKPTAPLKAPQTMAIVMIVAAPPKPPRVVVVRAWGNFGPAAGPSQQLA